MNPTPLKHTLARSLVSIATLMGLAACGGGDDAPATETTISGEAVKGPVDKATVTAKKADGTVCGTTTTANGVYSFKTTCTGDLVIEVSGGTYTDEATGASKALDAPMKVMITANGGTTTAAVTPLTTLAFGSNFGGTPQTAAAYRAQLAKVASFFGAKDMDLVKTIPNVANSQDAYGRYLKAVSKYLNGQGVSTFFNLDFLKASEFQAAFNAAMNAMSGITITFDASQLTGATGSGGTGGTGGTGGGATGGTGTLTVSGSAMGVSIPGVTIANIPVPGSQAEFCGELTSDETFKSFQTNGATFSLTSCSFSNKVGTVVATLQITSPISMTVPYNLTYTYR